MVIYHRSVPKQNHVITPTTIKEKLNEFAQIAKKNYNRSPNMIKHADINNVNSESQEINIILQGGHCRKSNKKN